MKAVSSSASPAIQLQWPHSTVPDVLMATHGSNGFSLMAYEWFTLPCKRKMSVGIKALIVSDFLVCFVACCEY